MQPTLDQLVMWAKEAGVILRAGFGKQHQVQLKSRFNLVTEMDHRSEEYLLGQIRTLYPDHSIVAEESGLYEGTDSGCWYVDPLDGTTNYAHHMPFFSLSLAYSRGGELELGVIFDPLREECFSAQRGLGAWLNDEPISVSDVEQLEDSLLVTGFPYDVIGAPRDNLAEFRYFGRKTQGVRRLGSAALDMAYVACGRLDAHWELNLKPWDIAAGVLLVREAGGKVSNPDGDPEVMKPPFGVLVANPVLHRLVLEGMRAASAG